MINGQPILLFGVDEQTSFIYGMIGSGLWGGADPNAWGNNNLFPTGIGSRISGVKDSGSLYREFFRYFLHYNKVAGSAQNPKLNLLRIWVADNNWNAEGTYYAWKNNPTFFFSSRRRHTRFDCDWSSDVCSSD